MYFEENRVKVNNMTFKFLIAMVYRMLRALPGGENGSVASVVYYLSKHLVSKGCDVTILERDLGGKLPREEHIDGIRYCRIPARSLPAHPYKLIRSLSGVTKLLIDGYIMAKK